MEKRILMLAVITAVGVLASASIAGGPLGPPKAFVGHGKWLIDVEYAQEDMDLKSTGRARSYFYDAGAWTPVENTFTKFNIKGIESDVIFGSLAYGLWENWDVYVRLGAANAKDDMQERGPFAVPGESYNFDGSHGFACGFGTRTTFRQYGRWTFGAVGQVTWINPGDDDVSWSGEVEDATSTISGDVELDWWQFQAGLGATYQADGWWIYGGPCLFFVNGDLDAKLTETVDGDQYRYKYRHDLREESEFGGWFGVGCQLTRDTSCYAEYQIYKDGWVLGVGMALSLPVGK